MTPSADPLATQAAPASGPWGLGERLDGRYLLTSLVGEGGMGVVYRAKDETLGRTVAIKLFRDGEADDSRTVSETRILAGLNHPSLVTLFDAHVGAERPSYLVMEYVEGPTLRARIARGPLARQAVAAMGRDLADGLHVVHAAGIVHRDVKPANVLLQPSYLPGAEFRAKLADFGIAHLVDAARLTTPGMLMGTAAYLSPEQVRGADPAPPADIYSLGLVLLEALTGRRAFAQTGVHEAALARLTEDPPIPADLGRGWGSVLHAMTARAPEDRPSALEVVAAIDALRARTTHGGTPAPGGSPAFGQEVGSAADLQTVPFTKRDSAASAADSSAAASAAASSDGDRAGRAGPTATLVMPFGERTPSGSDEPSTAAYSRERRRLKILAAVGAVVAALMVVGGIIWGANSGPPDPVRLPTVDEPLQGHLEELLDKVSP